MEFTWLIDGINMEYRTGISEWNIGFEYLWFSMAMQQEPKVDWRYGYHISLAYFLGLFRPMFQGISPQNMAKTCGTNVPQF